MYDFQNGPITDTKNPETTREELWTVPEECPFRTVTIRELSPFMGIFGMEHQTDEGKPFQVSVTPGVHKL